MELISLVFGVILGMFLTISDGMVAGLHKKYGAEAGRLAWLIAVAGPAVFAMYHNRDLGLAAVFTGILLFHLLQLQSLQDSRGTSVSLAKN
jgi:hypothetical protein